MTYMKSKIYSLLNYFTTTTPNSQTLFLQQLQNKKNGSPKSGTQIEHQKKRNATRTTNFRSTNQPAQNVALQIWQVKPTIPLWKTAQVNYNQKKIFMQGGIMGGIGEIGREKCDMD